MSNILDVIVSGVQNFQQNMFFRLQMLNYLLQMQELKITHEQLLRLWDAIAVKTKGSIQKKELIKVLYSGSFESVLTIQQRFFSEKDGQQKFFLQTLCNPNQCDYPKQTFICYYKFHHRGVRPILSLLPNTQQSKVVHQDIEQL